MAGWLRFQRIGFNIHLRGCLGRNQFTVFNRSKNSMNINRLSENVSKTQALEKRCFFVWGNVDLRRSNRFPPVIL